MTKTEALTKGLIIHGWALTDCPSGRPCYTKQLPIHGSDLKEPYYIFVLSGTLRGGKSKAVTKSTALKQSVIARYEECGRKGKTHAQLHEEDKARRKAAAGIAALREGAKS